MDEKSASVYKSQWSHTLLYLPVCVPPPAATAAGSGRLQQTHAASVCVVCVLWIHVLYALLSHR